MTPLLASGVDGLSREQAADAARRELSRRQYQDAQPSLADRVLAWVLRTLVDLLDRAATHAPGGRAGVLLLLLVLVLLVAVVLTRLRPRRAGRPQPLFDLAPAVTAADHRARSEAAAATGDYAEAVRERLRAVVRELEVRGVLDPRPGRTADEVARDAAAAVPALATDLHRAVGLFDEVWYGGRAATPEAYAALAELDRRVADRQLLAPAP